jgi:hypothetical protein
MRPIATNPEKELAQRVSDGIEVSLWWNERTNRVTVKVYDTQVDEAFELDVDSRIALDAYRHPFAYAAAERLRKSSLPTDALAA